MNGPVAGEQLPPPRARAPRKRDALALLRAETTGWLATGGVRGPHLVPLLFHYDGAVLTFATGASSRTVVNVIQTSRARVAIGHPYDLVMVEGPVRTVEPAAVDPATAESFAALLRGGPDPRHTPGFVFLELTPTRVQAWRSVAELDERELMNQGRWLV